MPSRREIRREEERARKVKIVDADDSLKGGELVNGDEMIKPAAAAAAVCPVGTYVYHHGSHCCTVNRDKAGNELTFVRGLS